ncbi:class I SAM-dependent DNA methyltransferase [Algoriphagus halophytocola]|uniref:type I restriction-modification system subunit M n=1 Tax=Algoriphagus halophytocola TaxID=2991499 RepID=UPI0022DE8C4D|nr:class I SAM-dependent DNA methyltransferase [Algoriphagus sp. TR-M9]WBL44241.1 class I SAM-dependent DNA methyltransferase [Algoriphagus sp. TR-M9]
MAKKAAQKNQKSMEETLWDSANKLRGTVESSEYKHVVLGLIFLKFASDKFEERKAELIAEGKEKYLEMKEFYNMKNVFFLAPESRWNHVIANSKQDDIALIVDTALHTIEKNNPSLKGALPDNYFSRLNLDPSKLAALLDTINNIDTVGDEEEDVVGRIYEYFLGRFAAAEGKGGGEFYTPKCIVNLIAEMLEPYKGKIYDPACGSGGMFVQSVQFVKSHQGNTKDISIYGQEYTAVTYKLAKMNLAIRGISANLGDVPANTFFKDQHPDLKADYIMANPPFNQSQWREKSELEDDSRWAGFTTPPAGNANYAWILHMLSKLSENGTAGFVLANGSMSTNTSGEGDIRRELIEKDIVDCMIALPGQLFYTTQIPVCLWFVTKNKNRRPHPEDPEKEFRDRRGETLFIDARQLGSMIDRTQKELTKEDIAYIANTYHTWRNSPEPVIASDEGAKQSLTRDVIAIPTSREKQSQDVSLSGVEGYQDIPGYCKSATLAEIAANDYVLTPGRYVGVADEEDDGIHFEDKMTELTATLKGQLEKAKALDQAILENLKVLGYE